MEMGKRIADIRKKTKMTQMELASKLFVSDKTVSSWESGRTEPSLEILVRMSDVLEVPVSYLIYGDSEKIDVETEIKIKITEDEFSKLKSMMEASAEFISDTRQIDTYYQPGHRKFLKDNGEDIDEWLRIGIRGNKKILNYKRWYENKYCDEFEVIIDDEVNLDKIFKVIGLEKIALVDKKRCKYMYMGKYEVSLDYVDKLGYFVEIEVKKYDGSPLEEYDNLINVIHEFDLDLSSIDKRGYPYHFIYDN